MIADQTSLREFEPSLDGSARHHRRVVASLVVAAVALVGAVAFGAETDPVTAGSRRDPDRPR